MNRIKRTTVNPPQVHAALGLNSQANHLSGAREFVFMSGQVALDMKGDLVGAGDAGLQTLQAFENIDAMLKNVGASFDHVVEFVTYLVGRDSIQPFMKARKEFFDKVFPERNYPPNTLLIIDGLVQEELLVEIKVVAALP